VLAVRHADQAIHEAVLLDPSRLGVLQPDPAAAEGDGVTATTPAPPPGWYQDPSSPTLLRFFDGAAWTEHTAPQPGPPQMAYGQHVVPPPRTSGTGAHPNDAVHWLVPTGRTWQSIVAGYVALFAIVAWVLGPVALLFGVWALRASAQGGAHGRGRALFAIVVGALSSLALLVAAVAWARS
jgi:hypothetical protein